MIHPSPDLQVVSGVLVIGAGHVSIAQIRSGTWGGDTQPEALIKGIRDTVTMRVPLIGGVFIALFLMLSTAEWRAPKPSP